MSRRRENTRGDGLKHTHTHIYSLTHTHTHTPTQHTHTHLLTYTHIHTHTHTHTTHLSTLLQLAKKVKWAVYRFIVDRKGESTDTASFPYTRTLLMFDARG